VTEPQPQPSAAKRNALIACVGAACAAALIAFVPRQEGEVLRTYRDPVGIITACDGHTGPELHAGMVFTPEQCHEMLASDLTQKARAVQLCITVPVNDGELAAYTSFAFNEGEGAFCRSTLLKKLNAGDHAGACAELSRWTMAGGHELPGLVRRRAAERALCEGKAAG
jgi:lysozyme